MARVCPHCGAPLPDIPEDFCAECYNPLDEAPILPRSGSNGAAKTVAATQPTQPDRIGMAIVCLRISTIPYAALAALLALRLITVGESSDWTRLAICVIVFCVAMVVGIELLVAGLRGKEFWAWVVGLVLFGLYVPSPFLPLGALGLWGLLDEGTRANFRIGRDRCRG